MDGRHARQREHKQVKRQGTFADGPVARISRLAGAAVASDHVEAQGVLIAVVESAETLVML